jgi:hypothetical protein
MTRGDRAWGLATILRSWACFAAHEKGDERHLPEFEKKLHNVKALKRVADGLISRRRTDDAGGRFSPKGERWYSRSEPTTRQH